jgi:hypothetical protein
LSLAEVAQFFQALRSLKHRAILMTARLSSRRSRLRRRAAPRGGHGRSAELTTKPSASRTSTAPAW